MSELFIRNGQEDSPLTYDQKAAFKRAFDNMPPKPSKAIEEFISNFPKRTGWEDNRKFSKPEFRGWMAFVDNYNLYSTDPLGMPFDADLSKIYYNAVWRIGVGEKKEERRLLVCTIPNLCIHAVNPGETVDCGDGLGIGTHTLEQIDALILEGYRLLVSSIDNYKSFITR